MEQPKILVLYYTQSGQLKQVIEGVFETIKNKVTIDYCKIEPEVDFDFPWKSSYTFFDAMPETVLQEPIPIKPLPKSVFSEKYDLIILGYTPWFLHPSLPITSFLKTADAKQILNNNSVVTINACRNMWLNAQEKIKDALVDLNASLEGNIVFEDKQPNLISVLTIIRWAFKGQKEASKWLPAAGISEVDILQSNKFGALIFNALTTQNFSNLQSELVEQNAININPALIILEQKGMKNFGKWAQYIKAKGDAGDLARKGRVMQFNYLLIVAIFVFSPISSFFAFIKSRLQKNKWDNAITYFQSVDKRGWVW